MTSKVPPSSWARSLLSEARNELDQDHFQFHVRYSWRRLGIELAQDGSLVGK